MLPHPPMPKAKITETIQRPQWIKGPQNWRDTNSMVTLDRAVFLFRVVGIFSKSGNLQRGSGDFTGSL